MACLIKINLDLKRTGSPSVRLLPGMRKPRTYLVKEMAMFYAKNLPGWERGLRILAGLLMAACGLIGLAGLVIGYLIAASGAVTLLTGSVGFCPMCAMLGRKLPAPK